MIFVRPYFLLFVSLFFLQLSASRLLDTIWHNTEKSARPFPLEIMLSMYPPQLIKNKLVQDIKGLEKQKIVLERIQERIQMIVLSQQTEADESGKEQDSQIIDEDQDLVDLRKDLQELKKINNYAPNFLHLPTPNETSNRKQLSPQEYAKQIALLLTQSVFVHHYLSKLIENRMPSLQIKNIPIITKGDTAKMLISLAQDAIFYTFIKDKKDLRSGLMAITQLLAYTIATRILYNVKEHSIKTYIQNKPRFSLLNRITNSWSFRLLTCEPVISCALIKITRKFWNFGNKYIEQKMPDLILLNF